MTWLGLFFDPRGRIGRGAFVSGVAIVYVGQIVAPMIAFPTAAPLRPGFGEAVATLMTLLQTLVLPYAAICLHLKRLRDAGRGAGSLIAMMVLSLAAIPCALMFSAILVGDPLSSQNLGQAVAGVLIFVVASLAIAVAWLIYGIWTATAPSRAPLAPAPPEG